MNLNLSKILLNFGKKVFFIVLMKIKILSSTSKLEVPTYPITPSPTVVESGKRNE